MAAVIDARQFDRGVREDRAPDFLAAAQVHAKASQSRGGGYRLVRPQPAQIELINHACVRIGGKVHNYLAVFLERIDVMEGEAGVALRAGDDAPRVLLHDVETHAAMLLPLVILNERPAAELQAERVHDQRELSQDQVTLRHTKRVHVCRLVGRDCADHVLAILIPANTEDAVLAAAAELQHIAVAAPPAKVEMRMSDRYLAAHVALVLENSERLKRRGIKANRERGSR